MVVGLWNAQGDLSKAKTRIGGGATTHVVATLAEAQEQVRLLIQPLLRRSEQQCSRIAVHALWRKLCSETRHGTTLLRRP